MARRGFQGAVMRSFGARDHEATVTGTERLAPHFLRVRMHSPTLLSDAVVGPTAWLRFWFPDGTGTEHQRAYTLTEYDEAAGTFAVDFVLHEPAGPASSWARRATVGSTVQVTSLGSSRFDVPDEPPAGYLLIGDSAAIPAISGILRTVPAEVPVELYLEEHDQADRLIPTPDHPRLTVHWVPRQGPQSLAQALASRDWSNWYAWATPESGSLKHVRARLREEFGFPKSEVHAQAYWYHGRAMGTLRGSPAPEPGADVATAQPGPDREPPDRPPASTPAVRSEPTAPAVPGVWRAQGAGRLLAPLRRTLIVAGVVQAVITLIQLAPFVLLAQLATGLLDGASAADLWRLGLWALGLTGLGALLASALLLWLHLVDARFGRDLRRTLLGKLARLPLGWFDARSSGQVKQLVHDDTLALHYLVTHAVPDAVAAVVAPVAVLVYLFAVDWRLALLLFVPVLVYVLTMYAMVVQSGARTGQALRWAERMNAEAQGYLQGQPVVRVFGGAAASTFRARLADYIAFLNDWQRPFIGQKTLMDLATRPATFLLLICVAGTTLGSRGSMEPVTLVPFLVLGTTFGSRLLGIGYGLSGLRTGLLAARRVQVVLDERELEVAVPASAGYPTGTDAATLGTPRVGPEPTPEGRVDIDRISFSHRPGIPVLQDISLTLEPGTVTALVGPSGSGKSTLAALLARFSDVQSGAIRIGGDDVRDLTSDQLYGRVGFVFQQVELVQGTVRENLALAVPDATDAQIVAAARAAHLHERILLLPSGYDTPLGPDAALSGGERQRLTIARAILADSPVLVLDEATAFADPESEYLVQRALDRLTAGRTVLVIAHRLHTITGVDRIVVLDAGRIVETGRHAELLARGGRYSALWDAGRSAARQAHR